MREPMESIYEAKVGVEPVAELSIPPRKMSAPKAEEGTATLN